MSAWLFCVVQRLKIIFCPEFVVGLYVKQHLDDLGMAVRSCQHQGPPFFADMSTVAS